jgi:hypothetical protein
VIDPDRGRKIALAMCDKAPYCTILEGNSRQQKAAGCNAFSRLPGAQAKL